jgi:hypothetical protein
MLIYAQELHYICEAYCSPNPNPLPHVNVVLLRLLAEAQPF